MTRSFLLTGDCLRFLAGSGFCLSTCFLSEDSSFTPLCFGDDASLDSDSDSEEELSLSFLSLAGDLLLTSGDLSRPFLTSDDLSRPFLTSGDLSRPLRCLTSDLLDKGSLLCCESSLAPRQPSGDLESLLDDPPGSRRLGGDPRDSLRLGGDPSESIRRL